MIKYLIMVFVAIFFLNVFSADSEDNNCCPGCYKMVTEKSTSEKGTEVVKKASKVKEIWACSMKDYRGEKTKDGKCPKCGMKLEKEMLIRPLTKEEIGKEYTCPVMNEKFTGSEVNSAAEYRGKIYYFCCARCPKLFESNPEKYIKEEKGAEDKEHKEHGGHEHKH